MDRTAERIAELRGVVHEHYRRYHAGRPTIGDAEYDAAFDELAALERARPELADPESPTEWAGDPPVAGAATVAHAVPMLSLAKCYDPDGIPDFDRRVRVALGRSAKVRYAVEPKVDGVACLLRYEGGRLAVAATRGLDGWTGSDVTATVRATSAAPESIAAAGTVEVHGELHMTFSDFAAINAALAGAGKPAMPDPRSAVTATLRTRGDVSDRRLSFVTHGLGRCDRKPRTYAAWLDAVVTMGVPVPADVRYFDSIGEAAGYAANLIARRPSLPFPCDGAVLKLDSFEQRLILGRTSKAPRWAFACKFHPTAAATR